MKKIMILAISAILAVNISAQESKAHKGELKKEQKELKHEMNISREQRIEMDIKYLTQELYLDEAQAEKFAKTYREYIADKEKLQETYKAKFGKDLNERQVKAVLRYHGPKTKGDFKSLEGPQCKGECKGECKKHAHKGEIKQ